MSRLVAFAAIQGGYNIVSKVEGKYKRALETYNADSNAVLTCALCVMAICEQDKIIEMTEAAEGKAKSRMKKGGK